LTGKGNLRPFFLIAIAVLVADAASKLIVYRTMPLGGPSILLLGDYLKLTYIHNPGAAFGLFQGSRLFFIGVSSLSILIILALVLSQKERATGLSLALGMIMGGACGNLLDRIWLGVVIDFIEMGIGSHRWPVYNVADIGVTVGVILLGLHMLTSGGKPPEAERPEPELDRPADPGPPASLRPRDEQSP
jgi:signal peptidase II